MATEHQPPGDLRITSEDYLLFLAGPIQGAPDWQKVACKAYGWRKYDSNIRISLGIEDGFKGSNSYFNHQAKRFGLPIFTTIEDTCDYAMPERK